MLCFKCRICGNGVKCKHMPSDFVLLWIQQSIEQLLGVWYLSADRVELMPCVFPRHELMGIVLDSMSLMPCVFLRHELVGIVLDTMSFLGYIEGILENAACLSIVMDQEHLKQDISHLYIHEVLYAVVLFFPCGNLVCWNRDINA